MTTPWFSLRTLPSVLGLSLLVPGLFAQETEENDDMQQYELTPFEVSASSQDQYYASTGISATQFDVPIKDIPFNLEVITSEFTKDIAADDFKESLAYSAGVFTQTYVDTNSGANPASGDRSPSSQARVGDPRQNAIVIRGFNAPFQERLGFRIGTFIGIKGGTDNQGGLGRGGVTLGSLIDTVNVDRNEVVRGPGALLYGLGVLSGIVNVIPKSPLERQETELSFTIGRWDYFRASLDTTGPLVGKSKDYELNYRLMGAYQSKGDWVDDYEETRDYEALQLEWKPAPSLRVFAEAARGKTRYDGYQGIERPGQAYYVRGSTGGWQDPRGLTFVNEYGEAYKWGAEDFYGPFPPIWDVSQWANFYDGTEGPIPTQADADRLNVHPLDQLKGDLAYNSDPSFSLYGPDNWYERKERTGLITLDWTVNENLAFQAGGFISEQETEEFAVHPVVFVNSYGQITLESASTASVNADITPIPQEWLFSVFSPTNTGVDQNNRFAHHGVGSWWSHTPSEADSKQARFVGLYSFETPFIGGEARHRILLGRQDMRDHAIVPVGGTSAGYLTNRDNEWQDLLKTPGSSVEDLTKSAFRMQPFYTWDQPFRYNGTPTSVNAADYYTISLWYTGHYAVYSGTFFNDRLNLLGGWRNDRYQGKEEHWFREDPLKAERTNTRNEYYTSPDPFKIDTFSYGLNYAVTDEISVYAVRAEGVIPNTGERDGNGDSIAPEQTKSFEVGIKFDIAEKISGTISYFQINRENAVWYYENAPNPGLWEGGNNPWVNSNRFDPQFLARGADRSYGINAKLYFMDLLEGDDSAYWMEKLGLRRQFITNDFFPKDTTRLPEEADGGGIDPKSMFVPGSIVTITRWESLNKNIQDLTPDFMPYVFVTYDALKNDPELREIAMQAIADYQAGNYPANAVPFSTVAASTGANDLTGLNASHNRGASVTYEEEATGYDAQIVIRALDNLQFILSYSHVEREATSAFNLVSATSTLYPELGNIATEFDAWVVDFGADAFADPSDPTTMNGGVKGKSLYFGSEDAASVWGRYDFIGDTLPGFGLGLGLVYQGPAATAVPVGRSGANLYPTPDTESRVQLNGALYYKRSFERFDLRVALNVDNILDNNRLYSEVSYDNPNTGLVEKRRTEVYLRPVSWRLSCTVSF